MDLIIYHKLLYLKLRSEKKPEKNERINSLKNTFSSCKTKYYPQKESNKNMNKSIENPLVLLIGVWQTKKLSLQELL
jgi:hypothetical protein